MPGDQWLLSLKHRMMTILQVVKRISLNEIIELALNKTHLATFFFKKKFRTQ